MTRYAEPYAAGYLDAHYGYPPDPLCRDTPSYQQGYEHGLADEDPEQFLVSEPAARPRRPEPIENNVHARQVRLFSGLDCLAGQQDLFDEGPLR